MSKVITAIFENGVLKPLQDVQLKEHEKVEIKILAHDEWEKRFNAVMEKIHKPAERYSPEEIEEDITTAIQEVRNKKRDH